MAERHARTLARLGELSLSLAEALHQDAVQAETPQARAEAAKAFHAVARSARQCLALEARLVREHAKAGREAAAEQAKQRRAQVSERRARLRKDAERLIWNEYDEDDAQELSSELFGWLLDESGDAEAFLAEPYEAQLARLCADLDLDPPTSEPSRSPPDDPTPPPPAGEAAAEPPEGALNGSPSPAPAEPHAAELVPEGSDWRSSG